MSPAHIHLLVNHLPVFGTLIALVLFGLAALRRGDPTTLRGPAVVLLMAAAGGFVALRSGEGAEEQVEDMPGVVESMIHEHEEAAELATVLTAVAGAGALGLAIWSARRGAVPPLPLAGAALLTLGAFGSMVWVGKLGGVIHHEEIRDGALVAQGEAGARGLLGGEREDEEEDEEAEARR